ncbi:SGNH/GDSL hydrolase family protein [Clostridium chauvoei]|uniref:SGNH/GDSL hydrolase family protein n=2 Tax=Clostridium chauvoei TaxID=46867 RepID=A0ABD4RHC7_9CLOT|nr:SGNH/GDSL hydrolase family protein [Clostridium chauvoei]ATD55403.1 hypothetical protein BTM20_09180 [Clostridium chauvoei]MBX7280769.1 SGNH/GDSL hydrolase family protein [Clostridium chauvoei]MBX7283252.1 SGNH/GDSL hydrolase family protein [Clostridium chauvoei]MBX7285863.1 SGNH/GDSL hydrolase family protein [Clostridium chauvoei]MBX7288257.1 SGNH/GDSL hydrolase family protein [Clostridium chauvoei]
MGVIADKIRKAIFGGEVRESIAEGIEVVEKLREDYDRQVINAGSSNSEIVQARVGKDGSSYSSLKERLDKENEQVNLELEQKVINLKNLKLSKDDILSMANMGQDIKEAMTGGSVSVVGKDTILTENIVDKQITEEKTTFIKNDINIFNPLQATDNKCIYGEIGSIYDHDGFFVSGKIYIPANVNIFKSSVYAYSFFDSNNKYISGGETPTPKIIKTPSNVSYIIITAPISEKKTTIVAISEIEIPFSNFKKKFNDYIDSFTTETKKSMQNDFERDSVNWSNIINKEFFSIEKIFYPFKPRKIDNKTVNVINNVYEIKLYNALKNREYTITCGGGIGKTTQIIIYDTKDNNIVCNYWIENLNRNGIETIRIDEFNKSGIYADITLNLDNIPNITGVDSFIISNRAYCIEKKVINKDNYWEGKNLLCIGDSITSQELYQNEIKKIIGFNNVVTQSNPGFNLKQFMSNVTSEQIDNADLISIMVCMNDFGGNTPIGSINDKTDDTFYGSIYMAIKKILEQKPDVRLMFVIPHNPGQHDNYFNKINKKNKAEQHYYYEYVDAVEKSCRYYGIPVVNLYSECGLNEFNQSYFFNSADDHVHPNKKLHDIFARIISSKIKSI